MLIYEAARIFTANVASNSQKSVLDKHPINRIWKALAIFCLSCSCVAAQSLPIGEARTLDGQSVNIPEVFAHRPAILILGFSRKATTESKLWSKQLFAAEHMENSDDVYGLVLLSDVPGLLRGVVTRTIRNDVSPNVRSHFLTVIENADAWRNFAQISQPDDIYLVIADGQGQVRWREHGAYTAERLKAAMQAFKQIKEADAPVRASMPDVTDRSGISRPGQPVYPR